MEFSMIGNNRIWFTGENNRLNGPDQRSVHENLKAFEREE